MSCNMLKNFSVLRRTPFANVLSARSIHKSLLNKVEKTEDDKPVKFTASGAAKFKAKWALKEHDNRLRYEPEVIIFSLSVFLIYFLVLREENDLDEAIFSPLYEKVPSLEQAQLKSIINHSTNKEEIAKAQKRLIEVEQEE